MRLRSFEIDDRVKVKLDKSIAEAESGLYGYMKFGEANDYPQVCEKIINGSVDAKACSDIYAKFLIGGGFENEALNSIIVGRDVRSKDITLLEVLRQVAKQVANHQGYYLHANMNLSRKIGNSRIIPFKNCRFSKVDDNGYCAKIGVYPNWHKEKGEKFDKNKINWYPIFNVNENAFAEIVANNGGAEAFKGMVYFHFLDNQYFYPLSLVDSIYLDADTQSQIAIFKNRQIRSGFAKKTIAMIAAESDEELDKLELKLKNIMGAEGDTVMVVEAQVDPVSGKIDKERDIAIVELNSNIEADLFANWEKGLTNAIRKAYKDIPAILIDYEESKLGTTSGEAIIQATNFYNAMTLDDRNSISESLKEFYKHFDNDVLANNQNWNIKPLNLYTNGTNQL